MPCDFCKEPKRALILIERTNMTLCYPCKRRLREAAPDLLALLEEWLADGRFLTANCDEYNDLIEQTRVAIAKAKGE